MAIYFDIPWNGILKKKKLLKCPLCKSKNVEKIIVTDSNAAWGNGSRTWEVTSYWLCNNCGIMFQPVNKKENGKSNRSTK
jgi:hypothetical protein